jgi:DNA-binding response OmpR family regulator
MRSILIVEDDPAILKGLKDSLTQENYRVITATDGLKGYEMAKRENIDIIILDLMLPGKNGQEVCSDLRNAGVSTPILMLTSKKQEMDKVLGLELGADDYVTKPFSLRELQARIRALLRRKADLPKDIDQYSFGSIYIDFKKREALKRKKPLKLSLREYEVLKYLIRHEGEIVTRTMLLDEVWGYDVFPTTRTVDNYILSLRKKIEDNPAEPSHILTMHTAGYKFVK